MKKTQEQSSPKNPKKYQSQPKRDREILKQLQKQYPDAGCALNYRNPLELLIATILSAQCTDIRVNQVTKSLFANYSTAQDFVEEKLEKLEEAVRPTGFYRNKAKNIQATCQKILYEYQGEVPKTMEELLTLPGVARKTANVVLSVAFGIPEGIVVDTHVRRLSLRFAWTQEQDPKKIERDLMAWIPQNRWNQICHELIQHGREICQARKPKCNLCFLNSLCPSSQV